jgi:large repetitive protein
VVLSNSKQILRGVYVYEVDVCTPGTLPLCKTSTLTITLVDPALTTNPPIANIDISSTTASSNPAFEGFPVGIFVLANDQPGNIGGELDFTTLAKVSDPSNGTITIDATNGVIVYTPAAGFSGVDTFIYEIDDTDGNGPSQATVYVTVFPYPMANVITPGDDYYFGNNVDEITGNALFNDAQLDNIEELLISNPGTFPLTGGTLVIDAEGNFTFTPDPTFSGTTTHIYSLIGSNGVTASATMSFTVSSSLVYHPDIAVAFVDEEINGSVATNDIIPPGTTYSAFVADAANPSTDVPVFVATDGSYTFETDTPGVYVFTYDICLTGVSTPDCEKVTLTITVIDPTDTDSAPVANTDNYIVLAEEDVSGNVLDNDINLSTGNTTGLTVTALNGDTDLDPITLGGGTLTLLADGSFTLAGADVPGTYSFTYTVEDADGNEATATVYITVYPLGSANVVLAADDYNTTTQGSALVVAAALGLLANDSQLDGTVALLVVDPSDATNVTTPFTLTDASGNELEIDPSDGSYTFTPAPNFTGSTSFVYEAVGTDGASAFATVYFTVFPSLAVNPDIAVAFVDEEISGSVATNDKVPAGSTYSNTTGALPGATLTLDPATGAYTFEADGRGCVCI